MKKVLFATTALIASAGIASAEGHAGVALSGSAEMGIFGGDAIETQFFTDIDVTFTLSGETDGGITFGAAVDLDENAAFTPANNGGIAIFISGDFGTLTMGDTDGALDFAMQDGSFGNAGSIGDEETSHIGYLGSFADGLYDGQILRYDYSFGDFAAAVSVELDDTGVRDPGYAVGATYTFSFSGGSATVGGGYQFGIAGAASEVGNTTQVIAAAAEVEVIGVSASVALDSGLSAGIQYSAWTFNGIDDTTHINVGVGYSFDAITVAANYGMYSSDFAPLDGVTGFGVSASYDLGGGLSAHVGYGSNVDCVAVATCAETNQYSLGLAMSF